MAIHLLILKIFPWFFRKKWKAESYIINSLELQESWCYQNYQATWPHFLIARVWLFYTTKSLLRPACKLQTTAGGAACSGLYASLPKGPGTTLRTFQKWPCSSLAFEALSWLKLSYFLLCVPPHFSVRFMRLMWGDILSTVGSQPYYTFWKFCHIGFDFCRTTWLFQRQNSYRMFFQEEKKAVSLIRRSQCGSSQPGADKALLLILRSELWFWISSPLHPHSVIHTVRRWKPASSGSGDRLEWSPDLHKPLAVSLLSSLEEGKAHHVKHSGHLGSKTLAGLKSKQKLCCLQRIAQRQYLLLKCTLGK